MKSFMMTFVLLVALNVACALARPVRRTDPLDANSIADLAPPLGATPPLQSTGFGDCLGPVNGTDGAPAHVPCDCPPTQEAYLAALVANVQAGFAVNNTGVAVTYPLTTSPADQHARITAATITLQNLQGPGKGCPLVSTTLGVQAKAIDAAAAAASSSSVVAAASFSSVVAAASARLSASVVAAASARLSASSAAASATPTSVATSVPASITSSTSAPTSVSASAAATPAPTSSGTPSAALIAQLAPDLGATPPLVSTGFGDCLGPVNGTDGTPAHVPCTCPPTRDAYIAALTTNVLAGFAVNNTGVNITFPTSNSTDDQHARITAAAITLQNLVGPGVGCPLVSTTLGVQSKAIDAAASASSTAPASTSAAPASTSAAPASTSAAPAASIVASDTASSFAPATPASSSVPAAAPSASGNLTAALIAQLAPDLGASPPLAPTGFGDCIGPVPGADGTPAHVPCTCPPAHDAYVSALTTNALAGFAVNNTGVAVTFPTSNSTADQHARITAAAITLQNLVGPGVGCPLVATTLGVQSKALGA